MKEIIEINNILPWAIIIGFLGSIGVEIAPIKINPWSFIMNQISEALTKNVTLKLDDVTNLRNEQYAEITNALRDAAEQMHKLNVIVDENEMQRIRWEILNFANSIKNGGKHTKDEFHHIIEMNQKYHDIIERRDLVNGVIDIEYEIILNEYRRCRENNDFL